VRQGDSRGGVVGARAGGAIAPMRGAFWRERHTRPALIQCGTQRRQCAATASGSPPAARRQREEPTFAAGERQINSEFLSA
jgi:hypothetical protein